MRGERTRARGGILFGLTFFAALQAVLFGWMHYARPPLVDVSFQRRLTVLSPVTNRDYRPLQILALGSSRMMYGLQADLLGTRLSETSCRPVEVLNFGFPGSGPINALLHLERLRRKGYQPDLVLVEIMPGLISYPENAKPLEWNRFHPSRLEDGEFERIRQLGVPLDILHPEYSPTLLGSLCLVHSRRIGLMTLALPGWMPDEYVFDARTVSDVRSFAHPPASVYQVGAYERGLNLAQRQYQPFLRGLRIGTPARQAFFELRAACERDGIPILGLAMPESADFRRIYDTASERTLREFSEMTFHKGRLIEAREWLPNDCFWDGHHLHPAGGERFTERLAGVLADYLPRRISMLETDRE